MEDTYLIHHGIKGQKWGVRRFQNLDGTRTAAGKARERNGEQESSSGSSQRKGLSDAQKSTLKKVAIGVGVAAVAGLAAYGALKYSDAVKTAAWNKTVDNGMEAFENIKKDSAFWEKAAKDVGTSDSEIERVEKYLEKKELSDIENTAKYNSSTFKQARKTLKGEGRMTDAELQAMGVRTINDGGRQEWNDQLRSRIVKGGYSYENLGTAGGENSRSIYKMAPGQNVKAQGVSDPDYYKRRRSK